MAVLHGKIPALLIQEEMHREQFRKLILVERPYMSFIRTSLEKFKAGRILLLELLCQDHHPNAVGHHLPMWALFIQSLPRLMNVVKALPFGMEIIEQHNSQL